jgi:hypothetical protein
MGEKIHSNLLLHPPVKLSIFILEFKDEDSDVSEFKNSKQDASFHFEY